MAQIVGGGDERSRNLARLVERLAKQLNDQLPQDIRFGITLWDPSGSVHAAVERRGGGEGPGPRAPGPGPEARAWVRDRGAARRV